MAKREHQNWGLENSKDQEKLSPIVNIICAQVNESIVILYNAKGESELYFIDIKLLIVGEVEDTSVIINIVSCDGQKLVASCQNQINAMIVTTMKNIYKCNLVQNGYNVEAKVNRKQKRKKKKKVNWDRDGSMKPGWEEFTLVVGML